MFKAFLIRMVVDVAFDEILRALTKVARRSTSSVDDKMVSVIRGSKKEVCDMIKRKV